MVLKNASILIVDDDVDVLIAIRLLLKPLAKEVVTEKNPNRLASIFAERKFDLVILDMNFNAHINTGNEGIYWLKKIREFDEKAMVVMITAYGDIELAIRSLKEGATDFLVKPWRNDKLIQTLTDALDAKKGSRRSNRTEGSGTARSMVGNSPQMEEVFYKIRKIAPTDANVLILGENGTGKDLIATAIHEESQRKHENFVKVDVGALTPTLFESELFGHKRGAFTDAREDRIGRIQSADKGTLFLDEIGNIELPQQAKLLSVLQNRQITPLGSSIAIPIDIRLICATNKRLSELADETHFRKDLIYRINTVEIVLPPLRERSGDIPILAKHFVQVYAEKYNKTGVSTDSSFIEKLEKYPFPGNVRELQYAMERAVIMAENDVLTAKDVAFSPLEKAMVVDNVHDHTLENVEKRTILKVIDKNNGNISRAAKELGITRTALYRRLNKYDL